jgi:hypothetical protein
MLSIDTHGTEFARLIRLFKEATAELTNPSMIPIAPFKIDFATPDIPPSMFEKAHVIASRDQLINETIQFTIPEIMEDILFRIVVAVVYIEFRLSDMNHVMTRNQSTRKTFKSTRIFCIFALKAFVAATIVSRFLYIKYARTHIATIKIHIGQLIAVSAILNLANQRMTDGATSPSVQSAATIPPTAVIPRIIQDTSFGLFSAQEVNP